MHIVICQWKRNKGKKNVEELETQGDDRKKATVFEVALKRQVREKNCFSLSRNIATCATKDTEIKKGQVGDAKREHRMTSHC